MFKFHDFHSSFLTVIRGGRAKLRMREVHAHVFSVPNRQMMFLVAATEGDASL